MMWIGKKDYQGMLDRLGKLENAVARLSNDLTALKAKDKTLPQPKDIKEALIAGDFRPKQVFYPNEDYKG